MSIVRPTHRLIVASIVLGWAVAATAAPHPSLGYTFTRVATTQNGFAVVDSQLPKINNQGSVLVWGRKTGETNDGIHLTSSSGCELIATGNCRLGTNPLNSQGDVVFLRDGEIYHWRAGALTKLFDRTGAASTAFHSLHGYPGLNDAGDVFFGGNRGGMEVGVFQAHVDTPRVAQLVAAATGTSSNYYGEDLYNLSVNERGDVAFHHGDGAVNRQLVIRRHDGTISIIADTTWPAYDSLSNGEIDDDGNVAFGAASGSAIAAYLYDGSTIQPVISGGAILSLSSLALNNSADFACKVNEQGNVSYIVDGPNLATDRVISKGDLLFGGSVTNLYVGAGGLNDQGQIVFWANLVNPSTGAFSEAGVFLATPVPEPSAWTLLGIAALIAAVAWRHPRN